MLFLIQVRLDGLGVAGGHGVLAVFQCENDEDCGTWDSVGGANLAVIFREKDLVAAAPPEGNSVRPEVEAVKFVSVNENDYEEARVAWSRQEGQTPRWVLGQLGGDPSWLQGDETPACPDCEISMDFILQMEEGHDYSTSANFGGGSAYVFACSSCDEAAFLWQR
jgi:hypothetical protein